MDKATYEALKRMLNAGYEREDYELAGQDVRRVEDWIDEVAKEQKEKYAGYCPCTGDESMQTTKRCHHCGKKNISL